MKTQVKALIESVVVLLAVAAGTLTLAQAPSAATQPRPGAVAKSELLDINTATFDQLKALPGMGAEYARRIIAGRPYTAKNQLVTRGILPEVAYATITASIIAKKSA